MFIYMFIYMKTSMYMYIYMYSAKISQRFRVQAGPRVSEALRAASLAQEAARATEQAREQLLFLCILMSGLDGPSALHPVLSWSSAVYSSPRRLCWTGV